MTVPLTGLAGFFTRQGVIVGEFNRVTATYGSALTNGWQSIWTQFASSDQAAVQGLPAAVQAYIQTALPYQQQLILTGNTAIQLQVNDDTPVVPYTTQQALTVLIGQMKTNAQSINRPTLSTTITPWASNKSDASVAISTTNQFGDPLDMTIAETITITCINAGIPYQETLQAVGQASLPGTNPGWPGGSGANLTFSITDPASINNLLTDGQFFNWGGTGNDTPTNWTIINGAPGVTIFRNPANATARTTYAAQILSDGTSATQLAQQIVNAQPDTVYAFSVTVKVSASDASGIFRIAMTDNNGNVLQNDAGTNLSQTWAMTGGGTIVTTSYQTFVVYFQTPRQLPVSTFIYVGTSTAPTAAKSTYIGLVGSALPQPMYVGGPYVAAFANQNRTAVNDYWRAVMTNSLTTKSFALGMDRVYGMRQLGVYFPSNAGSPTISDSLVTN